MQIFLFLFNTFPDIHKIFLFFCFFLFLFFVAQSSSNIESSSKQSSAHPSSVVFRIRNFVSVWMEWNKNLAKESRNESILFIFFFLLAIEGNEENTKKNQEQKVKKKNYRRTTNLKGIRNHRIMKVV